MLLGTFSLIGFLFSKCLARRIGDLALVKTPVNRASRSYLEVGWEKNAANTATRRELFAASSKLSAALVSSRGRCYQRRVRAYRIGFPAVLVE